MSFKVGDTVRHQRCQGYLGKVTKITRITDDGPAFDLFTVCWRGTLFQIPLEYKSSEAHGYPAHELQKVEAKRKDKKSNGTYRH